MIKTYLQKPAEVIRAKHTLDAKGVILGQLDTQIATKLIGKDKPTYTPSVDGGDYVTVINAKEVVVTGDKKLSKLYYHHSQFPGGMKTRTFGETLAKDPAKVIARAVYNMIPKNKLRNGRMKRLKVE